jgi:hypothetical protein
MFDLNDLTQDFLVEKQVTVDCLKVSEGQEKPELTIHVTDYIRRKEREYNRKYNLFVIKSPQKGKQEGFIRSDKLEYCSKLSELCVTNSTGLFSVDGQSAPHSKQGFKTLLVRYPTFLNWFADTLTEAFSDYDIFVMKEDDDIDRD